MFQIVKLQRKIIELFNALPSSNEYGPSRDTLWEMADYADKFSPFESVQDGVKMRLRHKKTQEWVKD